MKRSIAYAAAAIALCLLLPARGVAASDVSTSQDFLNRLYGLVNPAAPVSSNPSVGTTATSIAAADPARFALLIVNLGTSSCYVAPFGQVSSTDGIILDSGGGFVSMTNRDDLLLPDYQWWAVCGASGQSLYVLTQDLQ